MGSHGRLGKSKTPSLDADLVGDDDRESVFASRRGEAISRKTKMKEEKICGRGESLRAVKIPLAHAAGVCIVKPQCGWGFGVDD